MKKKLILPLMMLPCLAVTAIVIVAPKQEKVAQADVLHFTFDKDTPFDSTIIKTQHSSKYNEDYSTEFMFDNFYEPEEENEFARVKANGLEPDQNSNFMNLDPIPGITRLTIVGDEWTPNNLTINWFWMDGSDVTPQGMYVGGFMGTYTFDFNGELPNIIAVLFNYTSPIYSIDIEYSCSELVVPTHYSQDKYTYMLSEMHTNYTNETTKFASISGINDDNLPNNCVINDIPSVVFEDYTVDSLSSLAIASSEKVKEIVVPDFIETIYSQAVEDLPNLTTITIPEIDSIDTWAFNNLPSLTTINMDRRAAATSDSFNGCTNITRINTNASSLNDVSWRLFYQSWASNIEIYGTGGVKLN